jgi:hypothetical protein
LREDYTRNQIFTTGFYSLFAMGCGNILADNFLPGWWFWLGFIGGFLGLSLGIWRFRLRFFETLEAYVISGLSLLFIISLAKVFEKYSLESLLFSVGILLFALVFLFFDKHYKRFTWYKSGRVGFSGLTVLGLFFLVRSAVAMTNISMLSFAGEMEVVISGIVSFISFITVYNLSERT